MEDWWTTLSNTLKPTVSLPKLLILMLELTKPAKPTLELSKLPDTLMLLQEAPLNYNLQLPPNPYQSPLMQPTGNSTAEVFSATALKIWTTVSWLLVTKLTLTGLLRTLGEPLGELKDTSLLRKETHAVLLKPPHTLLFERFRELLKTKNWILIFFKPSANFLKKFFYYF